MRKPQSLSHDSDWGLREKSDSHTYQSLDECPMYKKRSYLDSMVVTGPKPHNHHSHHNGQVQRNNATLHQ